MRGISLNQTRRLTLRWILLWSLLGSKVPIWAQGGPPGGSIFNFLADPSTQELIYAATDLGVFRSDNAGLSWAPASSGITNRNVSMIAGDSSLLFAATFGGVFRSGDGGNSWQAVNQGLENLVILSVAVDPTDPQTVYIGTSNSGVFKSTNSGDQWQAVGAGLSEGNYLDIAVDPTDPQVIYTANSSIDAPGTGRLFKSSNGGEQWTGVASGLSALSLALDPSNPNTIYIGTASGISKSVDGGVSLAFSVFFGTSVTDVAVDSADPNILYAATQFSGVLKSTDGGATWQVASSGLPSAQLLSIAIDPGNSSQIFAGTDGAGVFHSPDGAQTWRLRSSGIGGANIRALALSPRTPETLLAGITGGLLFKSSNGGADWEEADQGVQATQVRAIAFDPANSSTIYAGSVNPFDKFDGTLFKTTDGGEQWQQIVTGASIFSIAVDPVNTRTLYIGTGFGVFKSENGGDRFDPVNDVERNRDNLEDWRILDLAIDPRDRETLYAAAVSIFSPNIGQIFKTDNAADEWQESGISPIPLVTVAVDPADSQRVYVGAFPGIFRSTDGGDSYRPANTGLPGDGAVTVPSIVVDGRDNSAVYAATSAGVYKSINRGDSWFLADSGLEAVLVNVLAVNPNQAGLLYAATDEGGVFKTVDGGQNWEPTGNFVATDPIIARTSVVSAADFTGGGVSPGEIVSIFGRNIGPLEGISPGFDPQTGRLPTEAEGVTVFFGEHPAPLFFVRNDQINCQVPFEVAGADSVQVRVEVNGTSSNIANLPVLETHPALAAAVLNQDLSLNSAANPESVGNFVVLFATGQGLVEPAVATGQPTPPTAPFPEPLLPVSLTIGGLPGPFSFAGFAPGAVGLLQINVRLPDGLNAGEAEAFLSIGDTTSRVAVTIFVR